MVEASRDLVKKDNMHEYVVVRSRKAKTMRISIYPDCTVKVTAPFFLPDILIRSFVLSKSRWMTKKLDYFAKHPVSSTKSFLNNLKDKDFKRSKDKALKMVNERLLFFNGHYGFKYKRVSVRDQKSRWGSCSHNGNLNFNYKIMFLDPVFQDYIIVHELCHIKELNHSTRFWSLVSETIPDYRDIRKKLRDL